MVIVLFVLLKPILHQQPVQLLDVDVPYHSLYTRRQHTTPQRPRPTTTPQTRTTRKVQSKRKQVSAQLDNRNEEVLF